jgi:hypothetical protein
MVVPQNQALPRDLHPGIYLEPFLIQIAGIFCFFNLINLLPFFDSILNLIIIYYYRQFILMV